MTALSDYAKLEAEAAFFDAYTGVTSDVILSFGERSLIIVGLDDRALAHWPLASLHSPDPKGSASLKIAPDRRAEDYIRLQDAEMIAAIQAVCPNLHDAPLKPARERRPRWIWWAAAAVILLIAGIAIAPTLKTRIIDDIAVDQDVRLGRAMRSHVMETLASDQQTLWQCTEPDGRKALDTVLDRIGLDPSAPLSFSIIDLPQIASLALPGGETLIFRGLLDATASPEALAGTLAHQMAHIGNRDPLKTTVAAFGAVDLVQFWWGVEPSEEVIEMAANTFLANAYSDAAEAKADAQAIEFLIKADLPTRPFAANLEDWDTKDTSALAFSSRHPGGPDRAARISAADQIGDKTFRPALDDRSWLALGNICEEREPFE